MNSRYIFRGKRKGKWVYGNLINTAFFNNDGFPISYILDTDNIEYDCWTDIAEQIDDFEVIPETVCRCAELKDKNGKWIFEGDILKQKTTKEFAKFNSFKWELYGIVTFGNYDYNQGEAGYCSVGWYIAPLKSIAIYPKDYLVGDIQPGLNQEDILRSIYPMEVIGNIHDNPKLLEMER